MGFELIGAHNTDFTDSGSAFGPNPLGDFRKIRDVKRIIDGVSIMFPGGCSVSF
jgi:hypothetical protein